jgi:hypothetical protein
MGEAGPVRAQMVSPSEHPLALGLPWELPLTQWPEEILAGKPGGMHRHEVRFVADGPGLYVVKELPDVLAEREYRLLRHLRAEAIPVVEVVGVISDRGGETGGEGLLITRHLDFSLPYRVLFRDRRVPYLPDRLVDALVGLLVRLHLAGFFWGDCSLSNTLFRRDAGKLTAYVVDVETGELHHVLSEGQRRVDLTIAAENLGGGLLDLEAAGGIVHRMDPGGLVDRLEDGYAGLWSELTRTDSFAASDTFRLTQRLRRLNDLGFDVDELEMRSTTAGDVVKLTPKVVELGYHAPRLAAVTGLHAGENAARRLLNDIAEFGTQMERKPGRDYPEALVAARWLDQVYDPTLDAIDPALRDKLDPVELYHQILEHRWFRSEQAGHDIGMADAVTSYVEQVLRNAPDERALTAEEDPEEPGLTVDADDLGGRG